MLLSALFVRYRDVQPIWDVSLQMLVLRVADPLPDRERSRTRTCSGLIMCNPLAVIVQQMRHAIIDPSAPSAAEAIGGAVWLLIPLGDR